MNFLFSVFDPFLANKTLIFLILWYPDYRSCHCWCVFCSDATSACMGIWSPCAFNAFSCGVKFENAIAVFSSCGIAHRVCIVLVLLKFSIPPPNCELLHNLNHLLCFGKWGLNYAGIDFSIKLLHSRHNTCFLQEMVSWGSKIFFYLCACNFHLCICMT